MMMQARNKQRIPAGPLLLLLLLLIGLAACSSQAPSESASARYADGTLPVLPTWAAPVEETLPPVSTSDKTPFPPTRERETTEKEPTTEEPTTDEPITEETTTEEPTTEEPTTEETSSTAEEVTTEETSSTTGSAGGPPSPEGEGRSEEATTEEPTTEEPTTEEPTTEAPTTEEQTTEVPATSELETDAPQTAVSMPVLMSRQLEGAGMDPAALIGSQLIVVHALETPACELFGYQKTDEGWVLLENLTAVPGVIGKNGIAQITWEGEKTTPIGYFALGPAYGKESYQETGLDYIQIQKEDYFVDDPDSKYYNKLYKTEMHDKDWKTAEDMYELLNYYYYCIYIQHNVDPIIPGQGSAIFIHVRDGDAYTSGCVGLEEDIMIALFRWLKKDEQPHILIY